MSGKTSSPYYSYSAFISKNIKREERKEVSWEEPALVINVWREMYFLSKALVLSN